MSSRATGWRVRCGVLLWLALAINAQDAWRWSTDPAVSPIGDRSGQAVVWTGSEFIVWGGVRVVGGLSQELVNTGARYDPRTRAWKRMSTVGAPAPRTGCSAVWTRAELLIWGGDAYATDLGDGARYDPRTDTWKPMSAVNAPFLRANHSTVWTGTEMIVWGGTYFFGGSHSGTLDDGGRYQVATDTWHPIAGSAAAGAGPVARQKQRAVWTGSRMLLLGGEYWGGGWLEFKIYPFNDLWSYDPVTGRWEQIAADGPGYRSQASVVWTGDELLVWGGRGGLPLIGIGYNGTEYLLADGWRYSPATRSWRAMSTFGQPARRADATTVWTGDELLVLGGETDRTVAAAATGGRYRPATDSWTTMTTNGAPAWPGPAAWTGRTLLLYESVGVPPDVHEGIYSYRPPGLYEADALPDEWQNRYFGEENPAGLPGADSDGDGFDNAAEYLAGTDPTDAWSRLRFLIGKLGPGLALTWSPVMAGRVYAVESRADPVSGGFSPVTNGIVHEEAGSRSLVLPRPAASATYYRLVVRLP